MKFLLSQAPDRVFDQQKWAAFIGHFATREIALSRISRLPTLPFGFYRQDDSDLPPSTEAGQQKTEEVLHLGRKLIWSLKTELIEGRIQATGIEKFMDERVPIASAQWKTLWPMLASESAMGNLVEFVDIELWQDERQKPNHAALQARLTDWMRTQAAEGQRLRKVLKSEASARFGHVPERVFNRAYKAAFNKRRGRPRAGQ